MKKGSVHSVFFFALSIFLALLVMLFLSGFGGKFLVKSGHQIRELVEQERIPLFEIKDVTYEDLAAVTYLKMNLINMGDPIHVGENWKLEFYSRDNSLICTTMFDPLGAGNELLSAIDTANVTRDGKTYSLNYGDAVLRGDVLYLEIRLSDSCANATRVYAYQGEKMTVRLVIPPSGSTAILSCTVDPLSNLATCTE